eukprot:3844440-Amphidinium_carterae.1
MVYIKTITGDEDIKEGIHCQCPGCSSKPLYAWKNLLQHIRLRHNVKLHELQGTAIHKKGLDDISKELKEKPKKDHKPQKKEEAKAHPPPPAATSSAGHVDEGQHYKPMMCWVKCDTSGNPLMPLDINGLCDPEHLPKAAPEQGKVQTTLDPFRRPGAGTIQPLVSQHQDDEVILVIPSQASSQVSNVVQEVAQAIVQKLQDDKAAWL